MHDYNDKVKPQKTLIIDSSDGFLYNFVCITISELLKYYLYTSLIESLRKTNSLNIKS